MPSFDELIDEAERAPIDGWDFSWLDGRATEDRDRAGTTPTRRRASGDGDDDARRAVGWRRDAHRVAEAPAAHGRERGLRTERRHRGAPAAVRFRPVRSARSGPSAAPALSRLVSSSATSAKNGCEQHSTTSAQSCTSSGSSSGPFPGSRSTRYRKRLFDLHDEIQRDGPFVAHSTRFLIEATKS